MERCQPSCSQGFQHIVAGAASTRFHQGFSLKTSPHRINADRRDIYSGRSPLRSPDEPRRNPVTEKGTGTRWEQVSAARPGKRLKRARRAQIGFERRAHPQPI
ncbi:hypothetical protein HMPREF9440_01826 [Sutterella parvirubra YIT 11816]|uniref:Uncharacterized protein n=1 Tax=Sutterella parvirubra YIT 11816 TaxID=762967 RepID=H3KGE6_9BURK|nr:hypothetical protein HMPREF9440_01826 [Sutterella parvirubra YIT 11816]